jgi:signal transduction histidine kinase
VGNGGAPVAIDLDLAAGPLTVRGEPERLSQVVENLLDNAISFSRSGAARPIGGGDPGESPRVAPRVEVELRREGEVALLAVSDSGPGIPEEHRDRIFDRFFTYRPAADGAAGRRDGHTGLGLAIARVIVEGCGGTIRAADRPGGGARFEVRLPLEH